MEKHTKLVIAGGVMALNLASSVALAEVSIEAADTTRDATWAVSEGGFVTHAFTFKVSNNVGLQAKDSETAVAVQAANIKGTRIFGGSSNGGGVKDCSNASIDKPSPSMPSPAEDGCKQ
ncbi:hypothetical protein [Parachitinimonas caeni]|uniref:DUF5666 domain-containing protein n=1 Tax=Parachitinimonas caeni TaxID=3031301 RepID=A0ABT7E077_9NEIS|nr:hypothetical protein [Parachitinimonas caeni]MDK2124748.1 hypothetical protein [Parachitinimonas caeni]